MNLVLIAMAIALGAIIIFYFALRLQRPGRLLVFPILLQLPRWHRCCCHKKRK